jgi:basic membrane protein A
MYPHIQLFRYLRQGERSMKMHSRLWSLLSLLVMAALVVAACAAPAAAPAQPAATEAAAATEAPTEAAAEAATEPAATTGTPVKVALLLTGPITDGGWHQFAYEGLQRLKDEGFDVAFSENVPQADIPQVTRGYADDGYNLIIGHGFEFGSAFLEIAPEYPDQKFFATTFQPSDTIPANLQFINPAYWDMAYAAGALAALMSKSGVVGFVGGGDNPTQRGIKNTFILGAEQTVPGTKALGVVTGDYSDAAKGREAAATMVGNGADVIWHAADVTGLGAIEGATAAGATVLGCYADQTDLAPDKMGSSIAMDVSNMVVKLGADVRDGTFAGGTEWKPTVDQMWHWTYGGTSDHNADLVPDETWAKFQQVWDDLVAGKIVYEVSND